MFKKIASAVCLLIAASLFCYGDGGDVSFRSDRTGQIAGFICTNRLHALPDGEHYGYLTYNGNPVTVIKEAGVVEHIGYSLFTPGQRAALGKVPCNFLERYLLDLDIPQIQTKDVAIRQLEDGFCFVSGSRSTLRSLCSDTTQTISLNLIGGRKYMFSWDSGTVVFPADFELLSGRGQLENERRLPGELAEDGYFQPYGVSPSAASAATASENGLYVIRGDNYYVDRLNRDTFFYKNKPDQSILPINDARFPIETIANYLSGLLECDGITVKVKMRVYGLKSTYFSVPLGSLLSYVKKSGCLGYWGGDNPDEDYITGEWILRNEAEGYNHVFRLQVPQNVIRDGSGDIMAQLIPFVPMHSVKYLFGEIQR